MTNAARDQAPYAGSARGYDVLYRGLGKDFAAEASDIADLVVARRPDATSLLDVACGTGEHLMHLQERFACEGVEASAQMAAIAREKLGAAVPIHEGDMRTLALGRTFDAVTCLFSSIAYMTSPEALTQAVSALVAHLEPGGVLVVDGWFAPDQWEVGRLGADAATGDSVAVARTTRSDRLGRLSVLRFDWVIAGPGGTDRIGERHEMGLFTVDEVLEVLAAAGCPAEVVPAPPGDGRPRFVGHRVGWEAEPFRTGDQIRASLRGSDHQFGWVRLLGS